MSEPLEDEAEVIDGLPVLPDEPASVQAGAPRSRALAIRLAAPVQAATAAVGGFLAGVAVVGLLNRRRDRRSGRALTRAAVGRRALSRRRRSGGRRTASGAGGELLQVVSSRSLLLDVHLLGAPNNER